MATLLLKMGTLLSYICPRTNLYTLRPCSVYVYANARGFEQLHAYLPFLWSGFGKRCSPNDSSVFRLYVSSLVFDFPSRLSISGIDLG